MAKIQSYKHDLPSIGLYNYSDGKPWLLSYGVSRGSSRHATERDAWAELDPWLDDRMHTLIKELDAIAQLKRKAQKKLTEN